MDFLVCPIDKTKLDIVIWEEENNLLSEIDKERIRNLKSNELLYNKEIISGVLLNHRSKIYYPIINGIPRMLTYNSGIFDDFTDTFKERIKNELKGYNPPSLIPPVGEESVIRSFSREWLNYDYNQQKYWKVDSENIFKSMRYMLDIDNKPIKNKTVLEVGIGIGGIANYFSNVENCELTGIDLSYAVDAAYKNFKHNLFFHIVQASAFSLPFREYSFDYVYSQGVLHHSSDPKKCFFEVSKTVKKDGHFYVWLYSTISEKRNLLRRIFMTIENIFRPVIWPLPRFIQDIVLLPIAALYILHQNILKSNSKYLVKYSWREAFHAARDRFTPRYAFRFSEDEIIKWYEEAKFINIKPCNKSSHPEFLIEDFYLATVVIGQKA